MTRWTCAIGDVHGCARELRHLMDGITEHLAGEAHDFVFLGDYVDRGPESAAVIETLMSWPKAGSATVTCLLGNHEQMMLHAYLDGELEGRWIANGGDATLASFGVPSARDLPRDVLTWVAGLPTVHEDGLRYYVHAGFRPISRGIDPSVQARLWVREPFLKADFDFGKHVVHGHSPVHSGRPDIRRFRTNLDTGCVYGGYLTAGLFDDEEAPAAEFIRVRNPHPPA